MDMPGNVSPDYSGHVKNIRFAPSRVIVTTLAVVFFSALFCIIYASKLPSFEGRFVIKNDSVLYVEGDSESEVSALSGIHNEWVSLDKSDLVEEPDYLNEYHKYDAFLMKQGRLFSHISGGDVLLRTKDNRIFKIKVIKKPWFKLPLMFWVQLLAASLAVGIGAWLWYFRQGDRAAIQYFISAIFIAICIFPAAIYSSRPLALPGDMFHVLSVLDHFGLYMFCAAMLSLNWYFPYPLHSKNMPLFFYVSFSLIWVANTLKLLPDFDFSIRGVSIFTLICASLMVSVHWIRNRSRPEYLILIKWLSLATIVGPGFFLFAIFVPPLFGVAPPISQGFAFVAFLFIYLAMAIAVSRYKLFEFERWWSESLIWMSFGILLICMDMLIIFILDLSYQQASWLALAITGWIYFPLRQFVLAKLLLKRDQNIGTHLPYVVSVIAGSSGQEQLVKGMEDCVQKIFDPIHCERVDAGASSVQLSNDGSRIVIPSLYQGKSIEIVYADRGNRLFNSNDQKTAKALLDLFKNALVAIKAKEDGMNHERRRIRQDMHDSLGGYLLSIMHRKSDPQSALLARFAWNELRDILSALDDRMSPLSMELLRWKSTLEKTVDSNKITFDFVIDDSVMNSQIELSGFQRLNLGQILREAVTNAFRHARPSLISACFIFQDAQLVCTIKNDGNIIAPEMWVVGRGIRHISNRAEQLKGMVDWRMDKSGCLVMSLMLPLSVLHSSTFSAEGASSGDVPSGA